MSKRRKTTKSTAEAGAAHAAAYAPLLDAGLQAAATRAQEMHHAIAAKTFDPLGRVPGLSVPTRIVQGVHDAITNGVYAAVRQGSGALMSLVGHAERLATEPGRELRGKERVLRNVLNGVAGDALLEAGNPLAITMSLHANGLPLPLEAAALAELPPRCLIFIHGLACDEHSWLLPNEAWNDSPWAGRLGPDQRIHYGALLEQEFGLGSVFVRYNTGLPIVDNARDLGNLLERLSLLAPQVREFVLVGHSMGGLVARLACAQAQAEGAAWAARVPMLICLGVPHHGAPLERLGHLASQAFARSEVTQPIGRVGDIRSQGIKDLRHGLKAPPASEVPAELPAGMALRLVAGSLSDGDDGVFGRLVDQVLGDGLVTSDSAVDTGQAGDVERVAFAGLGHMTLLNHPRVYTELRRWIQSLGPVKPVV